VFIQVLVNSIVQRSENDAIIVESLVILLVHAGEEQELVEDGSSNRILFKMIPMKRHLL